jgi:hypothetical protein
MENPQIENPDISEFERLIDENWNERRHLIDREWELRGELQSVIHAGVTAEKFEEVRGRERESRAELGRNLDQYDVLVEKWAAEAIKG